jgi:hypothetical protein
MKPQFHFMFLLIKSLLNIEDTIMAVEKLSTLYIYTFMSIKNLLLRPMKVGS